MTARAARGVLLALSALAGCGAEEVRSPAGDHATEVWFREEAAERGLAFVHVSGFDGRRYRMPEIMSGGVALIDVENDGDLDVYLVQAGDVTNAATRPPNRLFVNDGAGRFRDATEGSGAGDRGYGNGVACGDYDGDGLTDLYVTNLGPNVLLRNRGDGTFEDRTTAAGVGDAGWGTSACFADLDLDGDLDLFVCNYVEYDPAREKRCMNHMLGGEDYCSPLEYAAPAADVLYRNEGDGTFVDVSASSGVGELAGNGLGVVCGDFDGDGRPDLFVANDGMADRLWRNLGRLRFEEVADERGCALDADGRAAAGMGVAASDVDEDGDLDLVVCNLRNETDSYLRNQGTHFSNVAALVGIGARSRPFTRFGVGLCDFDDDGVLDLFQATGRVVRHAEPYSDADVYAEPNLVFRGTLPSRFQEHEPRGGTATPLIGTSRAAAFGDLDGDGGVDVVVVNRDGPVHLLHNVVPGRGRWIAFRALELTGADAIGARVTIRVGGVERSADVRPGYSYQASNALRAHFGLGRFDRVDSVTVRWNDGAEQSFGPAVAGGVVTLRRALR